MQALYRDLYAEITSLILGYLYEAVLEHFSRERGVMGRRPSRSSAMSMGQFESISRGNDPVTNPVTNQVTQSPNRSMGSGFLPSLSRLVPLSVASRLPLGMRVD